MKTKDLFAVLILCSLVLSACQSTSDIPPTAFQTTATTIEYPQFPECLLIGEWQAQIENNNFSFSVNWDKEQALFKGILTKQGEASQNVGFTIGEVFYTAELTNTSGTLAEKTEWRSGINGVSSSVEWRPSTTNINTWTTPNDGVFGGFSALRLNATQDANCKNPN